MNAELLLSDKFVNTFSRYAGQVTALHERRKDLVIDLQTYVSEKKAEIKAIDEEAVRLHEEFEAWKAEEESKQKTGDK